MTFAYPIIIALLVPLLWAAAWALSRDARGRRKRLDTFGQPDLLKRASAIPSQRLHTVRQIARVTALSLLVVALARPQFGQRPASLTQSGRDVLLLLDLSRSMNAADANGTRLAAARRAVIELLDGSTGHRFGLIVFGGSAFLQLPLTADRAAFQRFLEAASTDDIANPSTDLSRALSAAATTFEHEGERGFQTVLLISDGESVEGDVGPAIKRLRETGVTVFALGMGTSAGAPIPADSTAAPEKWHRDHIGRVVQSRLEEGDLRRAAIETNGTYVRWIPGIGAQLGTELAKLENKTMSSRTSPERADQFQWPLGVAILMLAVEPMIGAKRRRR